jgi:hypothetical protein
MKNRKPFKGRIRKMAEGADLTEGADETGTFERGVKLGRNVNISDDTRARAMAQANRAEAKKTLAALARERPAPRAAAKAAPRAAAATDTGDESERMARRAPAPARAGTLEDPEYRKKLEKGQALERVYPESVAGAGALGAVNRLARAAAKALPAPEKGGRLNSIMEAARKRAAAMREARQNPQRTPPRDVDEARMAGEGPGFRKGGSVRGCGIARKGLTKGKMR